MNSLDAVEKEHRHAQKLIWDLRSQLEMLETERDSSTDLQDKVSSNVNKLSRSEHMLRQQVNALAPHQKKEHWLRQLEQVADELSFLRKSVGKFVKKRNTTRKEYEFLLSLENNNKKRLMSEDPMEELEIQKSSLSSSISVVEGIKDVGASVLEMLGGQRDALKRVHARVLDIGVSLGISHSTMQYIERRLSADRLLVYCGMLFISVLLFAVWYWRFWM